MLRVEGETAGGIIFSGIMPGNSADTNELNGFGGGGGGNYTSREGQPSAAPPGIFVSPPVAVPPIPPADVALTVTVPPWPAPAVKSTPLPVIVVSLPGHQLESNLRLY